MNRANYKNFRNKVISNIPEWEKLSWREKINKFRQYVKDDLKYILSADFWVRKSDFLFLKDENEDLSGDKIFNLLRANLGNQFWIRATAKKYARKRLGLPSWHSWSEWTNMRQINDDNKYIHFYTGNKRSEERAIKMWYWVDEMLKNTMKSTVEQYAKNHNWNTFSTLVKKGLYQKNDLPILYIFWLSDIYDFRDRYEWSFAFHDGNYTFFEWSLTQRMLKMRRDSIKIDPEFIFSVSYEEYLEIDRKVRKMIKTNFYSIRKSVLDRKDEFSDFWDDYKWWINERVWLQKAFLDEIPESERLNRITKKDLSKIEENPKLLSELSLRASTIIAIWHYYDKTIYKEFSSLIWNKMKYKLEMT